MRRCYLNASEDSEIRIPRMHTHGLLAMLLKFPFVLHLTVQLGRIRILIVSAGLCRRHLDSVQNLACTCSLIAKWCLWAIWSDEPAMCSFSSTSFFCRMVFVGHLE